MEDRELLDLAAKAAGYQPYGSDCEGKPIFVVCGFPMGWNPLEDDGDAFRLAAKFSFDISYDCYQSKVNDLFRKSFRVRIWSSGWIKQDYDSDAEKQAAIRRVIVRAAAEIGKATP